MQNVVKPLSWSYLYGDGDFMRRGRKPLRSRSVLVRFVSATSYFLPKATTALLYNDPGNCSYETGFINCMVMYTRLREFIL